MVELLLCIYFVIGVIVSICFLRSSGLVKDEDEQCVGCYFLFFTAMWPIIAFAEITGWIGKIIKRIVS